jgi:hypothetical protein
MNNFHRYLNLPFEIQKPEIFNTTPDHVIHTQLETHYDKNMELFLKKHGLEILLIECFYTPPNGGKVPIHTDFWWYETDYVKINQTWGGIVLKPKKLCWIMIPMKVKITKLPTLIMQKY